MNTVDSPVFFIAFLYLCSLKMSGTDEASSGTDKEMVRHRGRGSSAPGKNKN